MFEYVPVNLLPYKIATSLAVDVSDNLTAEHPADTRHRPSRPMGRSQADWRDELKVWRSGFVLIGSRTVGANGPSWP